MEIDWASFFLGIVIGCLLGFFFRFIMIVIFDNEN